MSIVVVLGMHRSGTSLLAHSLHEAGLYLGSELMSETSRDNLDGHWEAWEAVRINNRILELSGGGWDSVPKELKSDEELQRRMRAFIRSLGGHRAAGWKDPRTTLTFPLWKPHLTDCRVIAAIRHPMSVARSLQVRNGMAVEKGLRLWTAYNRRLLEHVSGEENVLWFDFDAPPHDVAATIRRICEELELDYNQQAQAVFNPFLRHYDAAKQEEPISDATAEELYRTLRQRARESGEIPEDARSASLDLDAVHVQLEQLARVQTLQNENQQLVERKQVQHIRNLIDGLARLEKGVQDVHRDLSTHLHKSVEFLHNELAQANGRIAELEVRVQDCAAFVERIRGSRPYRFGRAAYRFARGGQRRRIDTGPADGGGPSPSCEQPAGLNTVAAEVRPGIAVGESLYFDEQAMQQAVAEGQHRRAISGGSWEIMGELQFNFLLGQGLKPESYLLDVGCGCLRGGVHFVKYLRPGHYFGTDISRALLEAGAREVEALGLADKLPLKNLVCTPDFDVSSLEGVDFDFAIAQSVFTHLSFKYLRLCLNRLAPRMKTGGKFFVTFFEVPSGESIPDEFCQGQVTTFAAQDPFHFSRRDLEYATEGTAWRPSYIGEWGHPKQQKMMCYERVS